VVPSSRVSKRRQNSLTVNMIVRRGTGMRSRWSAVATARKAWASIPGENDHIHIGDARHADLPLPEAVRVDPRSAFDEHVVDHTPRVWSLQPASLRRQEGEVVNTGHR
jgi:hypothetical protein